MEIYKPEEIKRRLDLLTPDGSIVSFISKIVEKQESELSKEKWYGTPFKKVKFEDDFIAKLRTIMPIDEALGYPPINNFIPKSLIEKKAPRPDDSEPALPIKISENPRVWFKQDDTFNQPFT